MQCGSPLLYSVALTLMDLGAIYVPRPAKRSRRSHRRWRGRLVAEALKLPNRAPRDEAQQ